MLQILNWEYRKPIIKNCVKSICNILTKIFGGNPDIAGWFVVYFLHNLPYTLLMYRILFYRVEYWVIGFFVLTLVCFYLFCLCLLASDNIIPVATETLKLLNNLLPLKLIL